MADHEFFGTVSISEAASASDHVARKGEVDTALAGKADTVHAHVVSDVTGLQSALDGKADDAHAHAVSDVTGLQSALDGKADDAHGHVAADISDLNSAIDTRVGLVVDGAPGALDTLNELAAALGDDANFSATVAGQISGLDTRIDSLEAAAGTGAYKANIGNGSLSVFTVTHNLGTLDVDVIVRRASDGQRVYPVDKAATTNTATIDFGSAVPTSNQYRVIVTAH